MRSHEENRAALCALCFNSTKEMRQITTNQEKTIRLHFIKDYSVNETSYPISLCSTCRLAVEEYAKGTFKRKVSLFDYSKIIRSIKPCTRSSLICPCTICSIAKTNLNSTIRLSLKKQIGRPCVNNTLVVSRKKKKSKKIQICKNCYVTTKKGRPHDCRKILRTKNFAELANLSNSPNFKEKFASAIIKEKIKSASLGAHGSSVQLATTTKEKLTLIANKKSPSAVNNSTVSIEDLSKIQQKLNLSTNNTIKLASCLHKLKGNTNEKLTDTYIKSKLQEKRHLLDPFFEIQQANLENGQENRHEPVQRTVIFCKNILAFLDFILKMRKIKQEDVQLLKIGLDGGGGFFKTCLNIQTKQVDNDVDLKSSGVKKLFILAIAKNIKENYFNVLYIWKLLKIDELTKYSISTDLKLANILMGIMSHSSAFPCTWCQANKHNLNNEGEPRTFENIRRNFLSWTKTGSNPKQSKNFFSCVHKPIPDKLDAPIVLVIPPPELHLLLGKNL